MTDLSVIVLSFNTADYTKKCIETLIVSLNESKNLQSEVIVIDNASTDTSVSMLQKMKERKLSSNITFHLVLNKDNKGFTGGNNQGAKLANGKYILLLNSDVEVENVNFQQLIDYMESNKNVGVLTVKVRFPSGGIDPASHRGFPTPWNAFCYFSKLEKLFGHVPIISRFFGGYHLTHLNLDKIHEIDCPVGAFFLVRKDIWEKVHGFDEDFFMYGEDVDLAYRIKELGYKIIYYPTYTIIHHKWKSGLKGKDENIQKKTRQSFYEAMKIFYRKHYTKKYPQLLTWIVFWFIDLKKSHT